MSTRGLGGKYRGWRQSQRTRVWNGGDKALTATRVATEAGLDRQRYYAFERGNLVLGEEELARLDRLMQTGYHPQKGGKR